MLVVIVFLFDNLRKKKSAPLTKESAIACFKNSSGRQVENCCSGKINLVAVFDEL